MKTIFFLLMFGVVLMPLAGAYAALIPIKKACADCEAAGIKPVGTPVQSPLKKETSLIGMAYLNYIYQNDIKNEHFCQAMLLMNAQVPPDTENPYVHLFDAGMGEKTLKILEDIQLAFDYSIGRSNPPTPKIEASIKNIKAALGK